jgi:Tol biopolymer transport system component
MKMTLPGAAPTLVKDGATLAALSPDGTRILYADSNDKSALYSMLLNGDDVVKVTSRNGTEASYSPDGSRVAFLWGETQSCNHIEVVMADGSQADAPVRVRDCGAAFITELSWIDRP